MPKHYVNAKERQRRATEVSRTAPEHEKPRLLREALLNHDMSPFILTEFAEGVQDALLALPSVQAQLEAIWEEEQADKNPYAHARGPNGCAAHCPACAWERGGRD